MDFACALFNWSYCVLCLLSDILVLRCMMFIVCVKEADLGMMAFVAYFALCFSEYYTMSFRMYHAQCKHLSNTLIQATLGVVPSISGHFPLLGQGGAGTGLCSSSVVPYNLHTGPPCHPCPCCAAFVPIACKAHSVMVLFCIDTPEMPQESGGSMQQRQHPPPRYGAATVVCVCV